MKQLVLSPIYALAGVAAVVMALGACTSKVNQATADAGSQATGDAGPTTCDPSKCGGNNECIADSTGAAACRLACVAHSDCGFNGQCTVNDPKNFCVKSTSPVAVKKDGGQWGFPCLPPDGEANNKACDAEGGFVCYGTGTTDAYAYCTHLKCTTDLDCAGGFYCGTVNNGPNVDSDTRTFGKTRTACLKREYCAPCAGDLDCPVIDGKQSRCAASNDGTSTFCATPCTETANCQLDAACTGVADDGTKLCKPRAGTCKGEGGLCSPCRSDADCTNGLCIKGGYSPERYCSEKATGSCDPGVSSAGKCPKFTGFADTKIGCSTAGDESLPKDQCIGFIPFGDATDLGCYTRHP